MPGTRGSMLPGVRGPGDRQGKRHTQITSRDEKTHGYHITSHQEKRENTRLLGTYVPIGTYVRSLSGGYGVVDKKADGGGRVVA